MKIFSLPFRHHSLTCRLAIFSAGSSLLLVLLLGFINTRFIQSQYLRMEQERLDTIMRDALTTLGINLSYEFEEAIKETGENLLGNSGVVSVVLINSLTGRQYKFSKSNHNKSQPGNNEDQDTFTRTLPVTDPGTGRQIGTLSVVYSREGYRRMMLGYYRNLAITLLIYLTVTALMVRTILKRIEPLQVLAEQMQSFSPEKGQMKLDFAPGGKDEISRIAAAANAMIRNINDYSRRLESLNRELRKSHEELEKRVRERTRELKEKQAQLAHAGRLVALGELAAGLAHEIGQPLQIIRSAAEIISEEIRDDTFSKEEIIPIADKIGIQVDRAFSILGSMRTFARHDNTAPPGCIDLRIPLADCLIFFETQFRQHGIVLEVNIPRSLPKVRTDPQKFQQIVVNLVSNARYAVDKKASCGPPDPEYQRKISVGLYHIENRQSVILEVRDNGTGMSDNERERCLEPFFTTKEPDQGTGLGLSIVYGIVTESGFQIEIYSKPGQGSTFKIEMDAEYD